MLQIQFRHDPQTRSVTMTIQGHAGSAPRGQDLICSAATMLSYTLGQAVQFLWEQGRLRCPPEIAIAEGNARITAIPTFDGAPETLHTFWVTQCGAHVLAHNYPQYVKLSHMRIT